MEPGGESAIRNRFPRGRVREVVRDKIEQEGTEITERANRLSMNRRSRGHETHFFSAGFRKMKERKGAKRGQHSGEALRRDRPRNTRNRRKKKTGQG